jgi:hypothetical protein
MILGTTRDPKGGVMELRLVAGGDGDGDGDGGMVGCQGGKTCPTVYASDRDTFVIQGFVLDTDVHTSLGIPSGEEAVEVPRALIEQLLAQIS